MRPAQPDHGRPRIPTQAPCSPGFALWRSCCWWWFHRVGGWRFEGEFPDEPKLVVIFAPHSSAWDGVWGLIAKVGLGLDLTFLGKRELFIGPLGWLLRLLGGLAVDRAAPADIAMQVAGQLRERERMWLVLAPEGTRKPVSQWKTGFWKIARSAGVPVLCLGLDYPSRRVRISPLLHMGADAQADLARVRAWFQPLQGKHRGIA